MLRFFFLSETFFVAAQEPLLLDVSVRGGCDRAEGESHGSTADLL